MSKYCVSVLFKANPEKVNTISQLIKLVYEPTLQEPECLEYSWYQSSDNVADFFLMMTWENRKAFEQHKNTPHVKVAEKQLAQDNLLREPYEVKTWNYIIP